MKEKQYHTALNKDDLAGAYYAIVPGDPSRAADIAYSLTSEVKELSKHREYHSYLVNFCGKPVLVCSSGIGGPSLAIAMEELAKLGITHFLRAGTSGAIQEYIKPGDFIISQAAVRLDGTSQDYAPIAYPAVASIKLSQAIIQAMQQLKVSYHVGITASTHTFHPGQERYDSYTRYVPKHLKGSLQEWQQLNVLNFEMEASTLFILASVFGLQAACFCQVIVNRCTSETPSPEAYQKSSDLRNKIIADTLRIELCKS